MNRLAILLLLTGCASITRYAKWPYQGPMLEVRNRTASQRWIVARDGIGRELLKGRIAPNGRACFRWPFIDEQGYLIATGSDTVVVRFAPWSADGWAWELDAEPVANPSACR